MATVGLRERKKARTRSAIRQHAMRLFREQGFAQTTVDQIAEAADVSPSTFFRYFPTKEAVILQDDYDERLVTAYRAQPPELGPIPAMRAAFRQVFEEMSPEEIAEERERTLLVLSVPELHTQMMDEYTRGIRMIAGLIAERTGRDPNELTVRIFAGALVGVGLAAMMAWTEDPSADYFTVMDGALAQLEAGLPV
jgi:AcrR family transcriptional regulator